MATYTIPRVEIEEAFTAATTLASYPQAALIMGPQYKLWRYTEAAEKAYTSVVNPTTPSLGNEYQPAKAVTYTWPTQPNNSVVDTDYTKVYFENVKAKYFPNEDLGSSIPGSLANFQAKLQVAGGSVYYPNRLEAASGNTIVLKNSTSSARSDCFSGRDVAPGDIVEITGKIPGAGTTAMIQATITDILYTPSGVSFGVSPNAPYAQLTDFYSKISTSVNLSTGYTGTIKVTNLGSNLTAVENEQTLVVLSSNGTAAYSTFGTSPVVSNFTFDLDNEKVVFGAAHGLVENDLVYFDVNGGTLPTGLTSWTAYWVDGVTSDSITLKKSPTNTSSTVVLSGSAGVGSIRLYKGTTRAVGVVGIGTGAVSSINFTYIDDKFAIPSQDYFKKTAPASSTDNIGAVLINAGYAGIGTTYVAPVIEYSNNWPVLDQTRLVLDDYTGETSVVYTIKVTRGGAFFNGTNGTTCALVTVTSTTGDGNAQATAVTKDALFHVGTLGLKAQFTSGTGLTLGDSWKLSLVAGTSKKYNIIKTDTNLWSTTDATLLDPEDGVTIALYLKKDSVEIPRLQDDAESTPNWVATTDGVTINKSSGTAPIYIYDPELIKLNETTINARLLVTTNPAGRTVLQSTATPAANIYAQYRALLQTNTTSIGQVTDVSEIEPLLGVIDPANPLAQGVWHALSNAADASPVYFIGVASDDLAGYTQALSYVTKTNLVYSLVPLTYDTLVSSAIIAHVDSMSTPAKARWRIGWLVPQMVDSVVLLDTFTSNSLSYNYTGTVTSYPVTGVIELFTVIQGASQFPLKNIRVGDTIRYSFRTNAFGTTVWDEVTVTNTLTNTTCLVTPLASSVTPATKIEVVRTYTAQEQTTEFVSRIDSTQNRRIRYIFPSQFKYGGQSIPSYFLAAACAGMRSGVAPHQPLTNKQIVGIDQADGVSDTFERFTEEQLNTLAAAGCWIVAQNYTNNIPFVRHQLTSAYALMDTNKSEDSITTNVDSIAYGLQRRLEPYIGKYNINPTNIALISAEIDAELTARATNTFTQSAGNQLISFKINSVIQDPLAKDRIKADITLEVPTPMNNVYVKLII